MIAANFNSLNFNEDLARECPDSITRQKKRPSSPPFIDIQHEQ
jgi:hypothetical protein